MLRCQAKAGRLVRTRRAEGKTASSRRQCSAAGKSAAALQPRTRKNSRICCKLYIDTCLLVIKYYSSIMKIGLTGD